MYLFILLCTLVVKAGCLTFSDYLTCQSSATAFGQPAHVTCTFHKNINRMRAEITVVHHPFGAPKDDLGTNVLACSLRENSDKPTCSVKEGYTFDGNINDRLTLVIPEATPEWTGEYACHITPPDGLVVHSCTLFIPDGFQATTTELTIPLVLLFFIISVFVLGFLIYHFSRKNQENTIQDSVGPRTQQIGMSSSPSSIREKSIERKEYLTVVAKPESRKIK